MDSSWSVADIDPAEAEDLSALAWVQDELRRSLEAAHKALRRHLRDVQGGPGAEDVDPSVLRGARQNLHQGAGALEVVGLPEAAAVLRASEAAVQRRATTGRPVDLPLVEAVERASFALMDFVARTLAGKAPPPLSLFPAYRAVAEAADLDRVHPADLWSAPWTWRELPHEAGVAARGTGDDVRRRFEQQLLAMLRNDSRGAAARMSDLCAELAEGAGHGQAATLWRLASAFYEALSRGLLDSDAYTKRIGSRLLAQLRALERGEGAVSERLAQDLLFFCAQARATTPDRPAHRLDEVRRAFGLPSQPAASYVQSSLGRFDPAWIAQARRRVAAAKESWSAVADGELARAAMLAEQVQLVGDSLRRLYPGGEALADSLQQAAQRATVLGQPPSPPLAMEVATSLLYLEASLEDAELDHPTLPERIARLARRVIAVAAGDAPQPLDPWMEDLYRAVSDRQTMGSVVQELRASLSEVEKAIDDVHRDPAQRAALLPLPARLGAMRGVLSVLGMDAADRTLADMRDEVDRLIADPPLPGAPTTPAQAGRFARLAGNLGALGFLIDMLSVQPQMARSLFVYDEASRTLNPLMGRVRREPMPESPAAQPQPQLIEQAQALASHAARADVPLETVSRGLDALGRTAQMDDRTGLAATVSRARAALADARQGAAADGDALDARDRIAGALQDFVDSASAPLLDLDLGTADEPPTPPVPVPDPVPASDDDEMRAIFLEEAAEVIAEIEAAQLQLVYAPHDVSLLTTVRRGFHTLKGSSRMVGLRAFGEAAWVCEQAFNTRLAEQRPADDNLIAFTGYAVGHLSDWIAAIAAGRDAGRSADPVIEAATSLRHAPPSSFMPPPDLEPEVPVAPAAVPSVRPFGAPTPAALDLDLDLDLGEAAPAPALASGFGVPLDLPSAADLDLPSRDAAPAEGPRPDDIPELGPEAELPVLLDVEDTTHPPPGVAGAPTLTEVVGLQDDPATVEPPLPDLGAALREADLVPTADAVVADDSPAVTAGAATAAPDTPADATPDPAEAPPAADTVDDGIRRVGSLQVPAPLFNIYLNEADELSRRLVVEIADWAADTRRPVGDTAVALAHSLGGSSATVGYTGLSALARQLEHTLARSNAVGHGEAAHAALFAETADEIRRLLHQFAAGFLHAPPPGLAARLAALEAGLADVLSRSSRPLEPGLGLADDDEVADVAPQATVQPEAPAVASAEPSTDHGSTPDPAADTGADDLVLRDLPAVAGPPAAVEPARDDAAADEDDADDEDTDATGWPRAPVTGITPLDVTPLDEDMDAVDAVDADLFPVFDEEAGDLLPRLGMHLHGWHRRPSDPAFATAALRDLHTFKGGARLAGAMRLGEMAHRLEADIERLVGRPVTLADIETLQVRADGLAENLEALRAAMRGAATALTPLRLDFPPAPVAVPAVVEPAPAVEVPAAEVPAADMPTADVPTADVPVVDMPVAEMPIGDAPAGPATDDAVTPEAVESVHEAVDGGDAAAPETFLAESGTDHPADPAVVEDAPIDTAVAVAMPDVAETAALDGAAQAGEPVAVPETIDLPATVDADADIGATAIAAPEAITADLPAPPADDPSTADVPSQAWPDTPSDGLPDASAEVPEAPVELAAPAEAAQPAPVAAAPEPPAGPAPIDWSRFRRPDAAPAADEPAVERALPQAVSAVRVRTPVLERMVGLSGEVSVTRSRIEAGVQQLRASLGDLSDNLVRLREQLRDVEVQAETQMASRREAARAAAQSFDPLEFDRFTRLQELTRMMAESVNDVGTVHRNLQRAIETTEDELAAQARLTRDLQDDLLRTRMVEFEGLAERLYRVVRQAAKETGKLVRLDILGGTIEVDRGVLDRMTPAFEHLLRNAVAHGIESPAERVAAGKPDTGTIVVALAQEGNDVAVEFRDDGAGLNLARIRARAETLGLLAPGAEATDAALQQLIFEPGFSTVTQVTGLAGRGIGMDVVRSEVAAMGGRVETTSTPGQGACFRLVLPLTTAVTQVLMLRCGDDRVAVPATLVEIVRRVEVADLERAYAEGSLTVGERALPFLWLGSLLQLAPRSTETVGRTRPVVVIRSAQQRVVLHVDEVLGTQEVVVKNLGPQLSRLPGLAGISVLASGGVALIYNPVALATAYGDAAREAMRAARAGVPVPAADGAAGGSAAAVPSPTAGLAPLVLVVDDSLTVRRVTQRLLAREGYRVALAKDGLDALERLAEERPTVVLSDIEMPRMDGFDLVRNIRADAKLRSLPVIMITSRIAQKHRDYAAELGVDHYLGKPYAEDDLLALVARYARAADPSPSGVAEPI